MTLAGKQYGVKRLYSPSWTVDINKTICASAQANSITVQPLESSPYSVPYRIWAVWTSLRLVSNGENFSAGTVTNLIYGLVDLLSLETQAVWYATQEGFNPIEL